METDTSAWIILPLSPCPMLERFTQEGFQEYGSLSKAILPARIMGTLIK